MKRRILALVTACVIGLGVSACSDSVAGFGSSADVEQAAAAKPDEKAGKVLERYGYTPAPPPGEMPGTESASDADTTVTVFDGGKKKKK